MSKKTKYDILNKEMRLASKNILSIVFQSLPLIRKMESDKYSEEEKSEILGKLLQKLLPSLKVVSHIGYENAKDIKSIDVDTLNEYLKSRRISKETFKENYDKKQSEYVAILAFLSVLEKEKINVSSISNPLAILEVLDGNIDDDLLNSFSNSSSYNLLEEAFDDNFTIANMSDELKNLVEDYHNTYMNNIILTRVSEETTQKQILKIAKSNSK